MLLLMKLVVIIISVQNHDELNGNSCGDTFSSNQFNSQMENEQKNNSSYTSINSTENGDITQTTSTKATAEESS